MFDFFFDNVFLLFFCLAGVLLKPFGVQVVVVVAGAVWRLDAISAGLAGPLLTVYAPYSVWTTSMWTPFIMLFRGLFSVLVIVQVITY